MKALITAGGHGTRLRPITHTSNKHLIPIANKRMIQYAIEYVVDAGLTDIGIVCNVGDTELRDALGTGEQFGAKITYIEQEAPLGLAHVVKIAEPFIGKEPFVFYLGDNIIVGGIKRFIEDFEKNNANCQLVLAKVKDPERFGVPEIQDGQIVSIEEKPAHPKSQYAVTGIYIYDSCIFEAVKNITPSARGELEISDAHQYLLGKGCRVCYSEITGWWKDTGKPADLLQASHLVLESLPTRIEGEVDDNSTVTGRVIVEPGAEIVNSQVRGPVAIGRNVRIENSYVGPYTSISDNCVIRNSEVEYSIIMEECQIIDVGIRIENSLLGRDVQIVRCAAKPRTHKFMIGDQSRVELV